MSYRLTCSSGRQTRSSWLLLLLSVWFMDQNAFAQPPGTTPVRPVNAKSLKLLNESLQALEIKNYTQAEAKLAESIGLEPSREAHTLRIHVKVMTHLQNKQPGNKNPHELLQEEAAVLRDYVKQVQQSSEAGVLRPRVAELHLETCTYVQGLHDLCMSYCKKAKVFPEKATMEGMRWINQVVGTSFKQVLAHETKNQDTNREFFRIFEASEKKPKLIKKREFLEKFIPVLVSNSHDSKMYRMFIVALSENESLQADIQLMQRVMAALCTFDQKGLELLEKERQFVIMQIESISNTIESSNTNDEVLKAKAASWHRVKTILDTVLVKQFPDAK